MGISTCGAAKKQLLTVTLLASVHFLLWAQAASVPQRFDLVITNGHIIDGTGSPWYGGDIGIRSGKIAVIGNLSDHNVAAPSMPTEWSLPLASSTCWASRNSRF